MKKPNPSESRGHPQLSLAGDNHQTDVDFFFLHGPLRSGFSPPEKGFRVCFTNPAIKRTPVLKLVSWRATVTALDCAAQNALLPPAFRSAHHIRAPGWAAAASILIVFERSHQSSSARADPQFQASIPNSMPPLAFAALSNPQAQNSNRCSGSAEKCKTGKTRPRFRQARPSCTNSSV